MTDQTFSDAQVRAAFIARSEGSPSPDLADRIGAATRRTRQLPKLVVLPGGIGIQPERLLWAAAISATSLALVGGLLFAGRQPDEQTSVVPPPSPSQPIASPSTPSADPSTSPLPSPSDAPSPPAEPTSRPPASPAVDPGFRPDTAVVTLTGDLRVRSKPGTGSDSAKLEPLLRAGVRLLVIEAAVDADGYAWYHVLPFEPGYPSGWVAAGSRDGEAWVGADQTPCPTTPVDRAELGSLGIYGGLACFGDREIQVTGLITCSLADVDFTVTGPSWLSIDSTCELDGEEGLLPYPFNPDGLALTYPTQGRFKLTGHFADPQSSLCHWAIDPPAQDPAEIVAGCRSDFVVTKMEPQG